MGILDGYRTRKRHAEIQAAFPGGVGDPSTFGISTPFHTGDFNRWVFEDIVGEAPTNTRSMAMRLPPVARSRNLLVSTLCRLPLVNLTNDTQTDEQPAWLTATGDGSSWQLRNGWTADDHMFYGFSCWSRHYDGDDWVASSRINYGDWRITDDLQVEVNGVVQKPKDVLVIPGLHEGILTFGVDALDDAHALYRNVRARLLNPVPQLDLHQTGGTPLSETEIDTLIDRWAAARQGRNGGVSFTSSTLEINELGAGDTQLMIEARNAAAVDLARLVGLHAGMIDATAPKASLNYETTTGRNQEFVDFDLALYMTPITARLSMDDCTEPGDRIDFDTSSLTALTQPATGPNAGD